MAVSLVIFSLWLKDRNFIVSKNSDTIVCGINNFAKCSEQIYGLIDARSGVMFKLRASPEPPQTQCENCATNEQLNYVWGFQSADAANEISSYDVTANAMSGSTGSSITLDMSSFNTADVEEYAITVMGAFL